MPKEFIVSESELDTMGDDELVEALEYREAGTGSTDGPAAMMDPSI